MAFEWDEAKQRQNILNHGVSFELASQIFQGPVLTWRDDRHDYGEERFISIGKVADISILVVVHTDREGRTRLISARPASRKERQKYDEATR